MTGLASDSPGGADDGTMVASSGPAWTALADAFVERAVVAHHDASVANGDGAATVGGAAADDDDPRVRAADERLQMARARFESALEEAEPFSVLVRNAGLSLDEAEVLALVAGAEADRRHQLLIARVQHDPAPSRLRIHGLAALLPVVHAGVLTIGPDGALRRAGFIDVLDDGAGWAGQIVQVHPTVMWALAGDTSSDPDLPTGVEFVAAPEIDGGATLVAVTGADRIRRRGEGVRAAAGARFLALRQPTTSAEWEAVVREATIIGAGVVIEVDDELTALGRRFIERAVHLTWVLSSAVDLPIEQMPGRPWIERYASTIEPTASEWFDVLGDETPQHRLTAAQLQLVHRARGAVGGDIDAAVRRLAGGQIDRLAHRVRPSRTWDDLVLSADRLELLHDLVARYRHGDTVYEDWGFSPLPSRGLIALFSGPSGTGKTLAAEVVAGDLGLDLYKLELSAVVSKYIGETEKNLDRIFDAASAGNVVLFFDEADSLFGKRSEVRDARDRYANIEVSYLLQRMEVYEGVVVLATNFERNIDEAFLRRIQSRVGFDLPDVAERKAIWDRNLPPGAPVGADLDTAVLADRFEISGGSIRNAALQGAFMAASAGTSIHMAMLVRSVAREYQKLGRLVNPETFPAR